MEDRHVSSVPRVLGLLTDLELLDLSGNNIQQLPEELGLLTELTVLDLSDNELTDINARSEDHNALRIPFLESLTNLKVLDIGGNPRISGCIPDTLRSQLDMGKSNLGGLLFCSEQAAADSQREQEQQARLAAEREALVTLYNATGGADWWDSTNWLSDVPVEEWFGVTTTNGFVAGLQLYENNMVGRIPTTLGVLSHLKTLHIFGNRLSGCIPSELKAQLEDAQLGGLRFCP